MTSTSIFDVKGVVIRWTLDDTVEVFVVLTSSKKTQEKMVSVVNTAISSRLLSSSIGNSIIVSCNMIVMQLKFAQNRHCLPVG